MKINRQFLICIIAMLVMFVPRKLEIAGMFSYRFIILLAAGAAFVSILECKIDLYGLVKRPTYIIYFLYMCFCYLKDLEIVSMIGFIVDVLVLYVLITSIVRSEKHIVLFIKGFLYALCIYSILCIIEAFTGFNIWSLFGATAQDGTARFGIVRAYGSFTVSINNGVFLMLSFVLIWWGGRYKQAVKAAKTAGILTWIALLCTMSRAPIMAAAGMHVFWLMGDGVGRFFKKHFKKILAAAAVLAVLCLIPTVRSVIVTFFDMFFAIFNEDTADSISDTFGGNAEGVGHRIYLFSWVWDDLSSAGKIWLGKGQNAYFNYSWVTSQGSTHVKQSIENFYLATLYKTGIIGLGTLIAFFIGILYNLWKRYKEDINKYNLKRKSNSLSFRMIVAFLFYFAVLFTVSAVDDYRFIFILMALGDVYNHIRKTQTAPVKSEETGVGINVESKKSL